VCTALTAAIVEDARRLARASHRLRPPLLLALDEAVNVAPIPRLEQLLSTGGGSGIQTIVVLQSLAAARNAWGKEMGDALLDFNNAKIVLGGLSDAQDLADLSTLLGQRDERVVQASRSGRLGVLDVGDHSWSWRQVPVMRPDEIRQIDSERRGHALLIARSGRGILLRQDRIFTRTPPIPQPRQRATR
jgi:type IV secretory pathway TraG/TraD family ATPase VirD4